MSTSNPAPGVGGTAKDGGLSTADTVADGGPNDQAQDPSYAPPGGKPDSGQYVLPLLPSMAARLTQGHSNTRSKAGPGNPAPGVGGTAKDGGLSTADTVADGGPDDKEEDPTFKPS